MINYIYELCKEYNCSIGFHIDVDGAMSIYVYSKHMDRIIIGANWSEENIKDCIKDVIRRVCDD